ncbi:MAG TPA: c-type cytochrome [Gemmataceae bacterium]|nr:c-type cytochrome [Gemmataceae bacterium]
MSVQLSAGSPDGLTRRGRRAPRPTGARTVPALLVVLSAGLWLFGQAAPARGQAEPVSSSGRAGSRAAVTRASDTRPKAPSLQARCARCHDADGSGSSSRDNFREIPNFGSHKWQASRSDAQLVVSILDGKGAHMPAYRGTLARDEARNLVAAIRGFDPVPAERRADDPPDDFERRFRQLQRELEDLKKQFKELSDPPRKP